MNRIKKLRLEKGLRQIDVAKKANVSLTWIWAIEQGFNNHISKDIKRKVAQSLGSTVERLFLEH